MSELVLLHHNEPMTTSLAIAWTENRCDMTMVRAVVPASDVGASHQLELSGLWPIPTRNDFKNAAYQLSTG